MIVHSESNIIKHIVCLKSKRKNIMQKKHSYFHIISVIIVATVEMVVILIYILLHHWIFRKCIL